MIFNQTGGGGSPELQTKTVAPSTSQQLIVPDTGFDGLSQVTVTPALLETKSVTPSPNQQVITPSSGYYGIGQVSVGAMKKGEQLIKRVDFEGVNFGYSSDPSHCLIIPSAFIPDDLYNNSISSIMSYVIDADWAGVYSHSFYATFASFKINFSCARDTSASGTFSFSGDASRIKRGYIIEVATNIVNAWGSGEGTVGKLSLYYRTTTDYYLP